ncbi:DEAD/DEAH box helicase [Nocardiopsis sp. FR4]|uniref:DEAD/DEAH box helicase n=1 Tax=Nocardiopsis sp. FR4 TaxID=2605985 RepID=UPI00135A80F2|nr:DEAD/DEAH box helicase [Nocardiopsis sp. FR4]
MTSQLDPIDVSAQISATYRRYLRSLLPVRDPVLASALDERISSSALLSKGPLLEATPPYETGRTPEELVREGVLSPGFLAPSGPDIDLTRPLYQHQEEAIRKARAGRNLVVATGTGSGKTESFLVPVLNELERQHERGELGPGVRALLLYPMNALANDQLKRLRQLLANSPHITFGRYTGETKESELRAREAFESLHHGEPVLPNELLSRERMRQNPPHLLLTNYAMLEYLLLRPADLDLFEGEHAGQWRFIALDEAHVYDGAKAAELAMLLRRLRERVAPGRELRCIATSATVGDDPHKVMDFASKLFHARFEWDDADPDRQDLVSATRRDTVTESTWGPLPALEYRALAEVEDPERALVTAARRHVVGGADAAALLAGERRVQYLRVLMASGGPRPLEELAEELFSAVPDPGEGQGTRTPAERVRALASLVSLGSRVRDEHGNPLLSARYHLFTRATDGAFTCLGEQGPHVSLARHEECETCAAPAFELGACKRCGDVYAVGTQIHDGRGRRLVPQRSPKDPAEWFYLGTAPTTVDDDDDTLEDPGDHRAEPRFLCTGCGTVSDTADGSCAVTCRGRSVRPVRVIRSKSRNPDTAPCLRCGARGAETLRRFQSGNDAAAAVVATALYQALPEDPDEEAADRPGGGRKLLTFSDSRQSAAFFAPYLRGSYEVFQRRRLILEAMTDIHDPDPDEHIGVEDLVDATARTAKRAGFFDRRASKRERVTRVAPWVLSDMVTTDDRQSLEGRGLLRVGLLRPGGTRIPPAFTQRLGLSEDEVWDLFGELVRTLRQQGALTMPEGVAADDEVFAPRRGPIFARLNGSDRARRVLSWLPTQGDNRRLNYVRRLLEHLEVEADPATVLESVWKTLTKDEDGWLVSSRERGLGTVHQVGHRDLTLTLVGPGSAPYQCDGCRRLHPVSVRGVCPTLNCTGTLVPYEVPDPDKDEDHYRQLYRNLNPVTLAAEEHTAQWSSERAAEIQQDFVKGRINALSCSTTFELGVDVGELQSVFMRNMPPTTANYVQRAGRAGRRADSAALVVTYAQRRSHDMFRYQEPEKMIAGEVRAPYVPLANERIDRRHAHSVALAAFFRYWYRETGESWGTVGEFFRSGREGSPAPYTRVADFLSPVPGEVSTALERILPDEVARRLDLKGGDWVERLCEMLRALGAEVTADVEDFEQRRLEAFQARNSPLAARFERTINTVTGRSLLGFLATRNVLPKYGFPIDTVELRTHHSGETVGRSLELARDLSSAIYEYAPGSSVVAGGKRWTSAGVYRLPGKELLGNYYRVCEGCGHYAESRDELPPVCPSCSTAYKGTPTQYRIPQFGFVASTKVEPAGAVPPKISWHGFTHVVNLAAEPEDHPHELPGGTVLCQAGSRGELVAVSDGPSGLGYLICDRCGWGQGVTEGRKPRKHPHPLKGTDCEGTVRRLSLAHRYETDIMEVSFGGALDMGRVSDPVRYSLLFALLEGASSALDISRDDIDGTLFRRLGGTMNPVLFDTVPGGAGGPARIAASFPRVLEAAHARVDRCDCGVETSCYSCLRNYRNQNFHDRLRRDAALGALEALLG